MKFEMICPNCTSMFPISSGSFSKQGHYLSFGSEGARLICGNEECDYFESF